MTAVTRGGPGLVAVGLTGGEFTTGTVWTSTDGLDWARVPHDRDAFGDPANGDGEASTISAVTAGGPGLVAVGRSDGPEGLVVTGSPRAGDPPTHGRTAQQCVGGTVHLLAQLLGSSPAPVEGRSRLTPAGPHRAPRRQVRHGL